MTNLSSQARRALELLVPGGKSVADEIATILNAVDALSSTEAGYLDGVTPGTAAASKVVVLDGSKGISTITSATITTLSSTTVNATTANVGTVNNADLILNSTNEINIQIGGVGALAIDDAAISANAAADNTAGQDVYLETQDGGTDADNDGGEAGGALSIKTGDGSAGGTDDQTGGAGGAFTLEAGGGGACPSGNGNGGAGAALNLKAGTGGAGAGTGAKGKIGKVNITQGLFGFGNVQTIDMNDATVTLTLDDSGTQLTGNLLFVDPNGNDEILLLPPEADCAGTILIINNTGGENITVKEDSNTTTVVAIATNEIAVAACDGTSWSGGTMATT